MNWQKYIITNPESPFFEDVKLSTLDAVGFRFDASGGFFAGADLNYEIVWHPRTGQVRTFGTGGAQTGMFGLGVSCGPIAVFNMEDLGSYAGDYTTVGGSVKLPLGGEADVSFGQRDKYGRPQMVIYGGVGAGYEVSVPGAAPVYYGTGTTYDWTDVTRNAIAQVGDTALKTGEYRPFYYPSCGW